MATTRSVVGYRVIVIVSPLVTIILGNQLSRASNIFYMIWQLIGDGGRKIQTSFSLVGDQLELVVDVGLAILTVAGGHLDIFSLVITFRRCTLRRLVGRHLDQLHGGRCTRDGVLVLTGTATGLVLEVNGLSFAQPGGIAQRGVACDLNGFHRIAAVKALLMEHQLEGLDLRICEIVRYSFSGALCGL